MRDIERVIDILGRTSDGRELFQTEQEIERHGNNGDGQWLAFLQSGCNNNLNEFGSRILAVFHEHVIAGDYKYPLSEFVSKFVSEPVPA